MATEQTRQELASSRYSNLYEFLSTTNTSEPTKSSENINTFKSFLDIQWTLNKYDKMYVSFGSKWNAPVQPFEQNGAMQNVHTNASYQMVPQYLRVRIKGTNGSLKIPPLINGHDNTLKIPPLINGHDNSLKIPPFTNNTPPLNGPDNTIQSSLNKKHLVIVVDVFSNITILEENRRQLRNLADHYPDLDIIVLDCNLVKRTLKTILEYLTEKAATFEMADNQVMFCNYIRFSRPNALESKIEELVPKNIQLILDQCVSGRYQTRFYQWYGPTFYMYNLVYNYKLYNLLLMRHFPHLLQICQRTLRDAQVSNDNLFLVEMQLDDVFGHNKALMWTEFCKHSIDIRGNLRVYS